MFCNFFGERALIEVRVLIKRTTIKREALIKKGGACLLEEGRLIKFLPIV